MDRRLSKQLRGGWVHHEVACCCQGKGVVSGCSCSDGCGIAVGALAAQQVWWWWHRAKRHGTAQHDSAKHVSETVSVREKSKRIGKLHNEMKTAFLPPPCQPHQITHLDTSSRCPPTPTPTPTPSPAAAAASLDMRSRMPRSPPPLGPLPSGPSPIIIRALLDRRPVRLSTAAAPSSV